jgi:hypothetical protein
MTKVTSKLKAVYVRAYTRFRFARWEHVRAHWRSHPDQMTFGF